MILVGYCRVSTGNQKEEGTVAQQERSLTEYCKKHNHVLLKIFKDEAVSGALGNRDGLNSLFDFVEATSGIEGVLFLKLDRLARDLYVQEGLIQQIEKKGVRPMSIVERDLDSSDPMRKAFRQFMGIVSELEKEFITMRLSGGRISKARQGGYAGGRPAYGFRVERGDLALNIDETETLVLMFSLKRKGLGYNEIARHLNSLGRPSPSGRQWYAKTVSIILSNPIYKGWYSYKDQKVRRDDFKVSGMRQIVGV